MFSTLRLRPLTAILTLFYSTFSFAATCAFPGEPDGTQKIALVKVVSGLTKPVALAFFPKAEDGALVVEQAGQIKLWQGQTTKVALDLRSTVDSSGNEMGLLGLTLHPKFASNRLAYLNYTPRGPRKTRISEWKVNADGTFAQGSERIILEIDQPYENHNGGTLNFGPDGFLYIGMGDGGSGDDPQGNGQNLKVLLAKMLRIDVDHKDGQLAYAIPKDNPFRTKDGARPEIYAYGLRNPWKWSFDRATGQLWAGDVGQNFLEEVDIVKAGGNYGWKIMEGNQCRGGGTNCNRANLNLPVIDYPRSEGVSVTGGYVYRGKKWPEMAGTYFYADYAMGTIWGLKADEAAPKPVVVAKSGLNISSFGEDVAGELYVLDHGNGAILRIDRNTTTGTSTFPKKISETKCFSSNDPQKPIDGMIPLQVNAPLWSDGASKQRFLYLPNGSKMQFAAEGSWHLPEGAVVVKNFFVKPVGRNTEQLIETRFLVQKADGVHGYSYEWNDDGTDATYVSGGSSRPLTVTDTDGSNVSYAHYYPGSGECSRCHVPGKSDYLAINTLQLNKAITTPNGQEQNQIFYLRDKGYVASENWPNDPGVWPALTNPQDSAADLNLRARSWLQVQCGSCHQPQGVTQARFDARFTTALAATGLCNGEPLGGDLGVKGARILVPGHPELSLVTMRIASTNPSLRMPSIGTTRIDKVGQALLQDWVTQHSSCM